MRTLPLEKFRNIGIIAHIDAGKTTVTERILFYTGISHRIGEVHEGKAIMDWMEQEKERGITITAAATTCFWEPRVYQKPSLERQYQINIIDTPGHVDFTAEVERSLRVLDGAIVVFDGVAGVEAQSEKVWHQADKYKVPRICFINKLDRIGADFYQSLRSIQEKLHPNAIALQFPVGKESEFYGVVDLISNQLYRFEGEWGQHPKTEEIPEHLKDKVKVEREKLIERIVETDDKLTEKYLNGEEISPEELRTALRKAVLDYQLIPVLGGSALRNKGIQLLLDAVVDYLPSPIDLPPVKGINPETGQEETREPKDSEPFSALVFKIATDPYVGTLSYFRVYSGEFARGNYALNSNQRNQERISRIVRMHAQHREEMPEIRTGDIGAFVGLKQVKTGDTICNASAPIVLGQISFPEPVISMRVEPKTKADQEKMGIALAKLKEEDPTFKVKVDSETGETIISGMGELHLEILVERMRREFAVETNVGKPQVAYKETIETVADAEGKYIRQSGGRGQYGHVFLKIEPLGRGEGFQFVNAIRGGVIPENFIPAVEKGVREVMDQGILAGYPVVDVKATLYDGSFHEVDSSDIAFKIAASIAFKEAAKKARLFLLEPTMKVQVVIPSQFLGDITGDLSSRRAKVESVEDRYTVKVINAKVPLAEMFGYATILRSLTQGRGSFTMEFSHYQRVPQNIAQEIIEGKK